MHKANCIKIEELKILKNRILLYRLSYPKKIKKYFLSDSFYVGYDEDINNVDVSILHIPVISSVITLAWATGTDIHVEELDKTYLESLERTRRVIKKWYPSLPFSTKIDVGRVVSNSFSNLGYGLLFSGGVDSTTSYLRHRDKKPNLIMFWGADIPLTNKNFWKRVKDRYTRFANEENVKINFIKTNLRRFIDDRFLDVAIGRHREDFSWWGSFSHGLAQLGLCAPLTAVEHIGTMLIASSCWEGSWIQVWGSHPLLDNKISWANVKVAHDGYDLSRQGKIRNVLKSYVGRNDVLLRVCTGTPPPPLFNCSRCEKSLRTITGLVLENIDPTKCGFDVDKSCFDVLKQNFTEGKFILDTHEHMLWNDIQRHIPKTMNHNLYNSKEFFNWFKDFDLSRCRRKWSLKQNTLLCLDRLFYKLPKNIRNIPSVPPTYYDARRHISKIIKA